MEKVPTAEEFFEQTIQRGVNDTHTNYLKAAREFAKLHVEATLKYAVAVLDRNNDGDYIEHPTQERILNAYPLENIK